MQLSWGYDDYWIVYRGELYHYAVFGLVTLTFDLGQWSSIAGHVLYPSAKFEDLRLSHC